MKVGSLFNLEGISLYITIAINIVLVLLGANNVLLVDLLVVCHVGDVGDHILGELGSLLYALQFGVLFHAELIRDRVCHCLSNVVGVGLQTARRDLASLLLLLEHLLVVQFLLFLQLFLLLLINCSQFERTCLGHPLHLSEAVVVAA